jgi:hypothetical protein
VVGVVEARGRRAQTPQGCRAAVAEHVTPDGRHASKLSKTVRGQSKTGARREGERGSEGGGLPTGKEQRSGNEGRGRRMYGVCCPSSSFPSSSFPARTRRNDRHSPPVVLSFPLSSSRPQPQGCGGGRGDEGSARGKVRRRGGAGEGSHHLTPRSLPNELLW